MPQKTGFPSAASGKSLCVRVIFCRCLVVYSGRIDAELELGDRLIIVKDDGAVIVHGPSGLKERNWMPSGSTWHEEPGKFVSEHVKRGEKLEVFVEQIIDDRTHEAELDGKLIKLGSEREMSDLIASQLDRVEPGLLLVQREAPTPVGPIDILATDAASAPVIIEIKRQPGVSIESCYQLLRYIESVQTMEEWKGCTPRGILVAPGLRKGVKEFLDQRGLGYVRISYNDLKGRRDEQPKRRPARKKRKG